MTLLVLNNWAQINSCLSEETLDVWLANELPTDWSDSVDAQADPSLCQADVTRYIFLKGLDTLG